MNKQIIESGNILTLQSFEGRKKDQILLSEARRQFERLLPMKQKAA